MQKLARIDSTPAVQQQMCVSDSRTILVINTEAFSVSAKPSIGQPMYTKSVLLKDMFNPEEYVGPLLSQAMPSRSTFQRNRGELGQRIG